MAHTNTTHFTRLILLCVALATIIGVFRGVSVRMGTSRSQDRSSPQIDNRTRGLIVTNVATENSSVRLTLRNDYDKSIDGYIISTSPKGKNEVDLTIGEKVIKPGESIDFNGSYSLPDNPAASQARITVLAVFFTDHSSDGDAVAIKEMEERRRGTKIQLGRIVPLLKASQYKSGSFSEAVAALKTEISALSDTENESDKWTTRRGLRAAKEDLLRDLGEVEAALNAGNDAKAQRFFQELVERHQKRLTKL